MTAAKYMINFLKSSLMASLVVLSQAAYAGIAGDVQFAIGSVRVSNAAGQTHAVQKSDVVHESDTVITAKGASAQIKMRDGGFIVIRPDSQLKFDSFVYSGEQDGSERSFFSLIKGGIRTITGLIGQKNKSNYRIATPTSTIGIRGTDHETFVVVPGSELAATVPAGTYNKVNVGETTMTTDKGTINILPNQMGFVGGLKQMPQLQPVNLNIFTVTPAPMPQAKGDKGAVRDNAVVDNAIQDPSHAPGNAVPGRPIQIPIKGGTGGGATTGVTVAPIVF